MTTTPSTIRPLLSVEDETRYDRLQAARAQVEVLRPLIAQAEHLNGLVQAMFDEAMLTIEGGGKWPHCDRAQALATMIEVGGLE